MEFAYTGNASPNGALALSPAKIFPTTEEGLIPAEQATLLLKVTNASGEAFYRWLDVRDFNIPYWLGYTTEADMKMKLGSATDAPGEFDCKITYGQTTKVML